MLERCAREIQNGCAHKAVPKTSRNVFQVCLGFFGVFFQPIRTCRLVSIAVLHNLMGRNSKNIPLFLILILLMNIAYLICISARQNMFKQRIKVQHANHTQLLESQHTLQKNCLMNSWKDCYPKHLDSSMNLQSCFKIKVTSDTKIDCSSTRSCTCNSVCVVFSPLCQKWHQRNHSFIHIYMFCTCRIFLTVKFDPSFTYTDI